MNWITTYNLHRGHVAFPPKIFPELWTSSRKTIICVHQQMNERIQHSVECSKTALLKKKIKKKIQQQDKNYDYKYKIYI